VAGRELDIVDAGRRGIDADLARRELTINAIAFDVVRGRVHDPLGGLRDLRARILRLPRPGVVREDPVRALRVARFLAELPAFRLHRAAREECRGAGRALARAPAARMRDELCALLAAADPVRGLTLLADFGLLAAVLPELVPLRACVAGAGRPDVWSHTLRTVDAAARRRRLPGAAAGATADAMLVARWTLLLHDVAKPETLQLDATGRPTFHGHEVLGARRARAILRRLSLPRAFVRRVSRLVLFHLRPHHLAEAGAPERGMRRLVRESGDDLPLLVFHAACDAVGSGAQDGAAKWRRLRPVLTRLLALHAAARAAPAERLLGGREVMAALGIGAGPEVGAALRELLELQERGELTDRAGALSYLESKRRR
jgi:poly(A) polymerase